jgi:hypothetical protein
MLEHVISFLLLHGEVDSYLRLRTLNRFVRCTLSALLQLVFVLFAYRQMVLPFDVVPIINIPGYGNMSAEVRHHLYTDTTFIALVFTDGQPLLFNYVNSKQHARQHVRGLRYHYSNLHVRLRTNSS